MKKKALPFQTENEDGVIFQFNQSYATVNT